MIYLFYFFVLFLNQFTYAMPSNSWNGPFIYRKIHYIIHCTHSKQIKKICRHLARNPFICDCNLRWLADYLHKNPIETSGARCDAPKRMHRRKIEALRDDKFKCELKFLLFVSLNTF